MADKRLDELNYLRTVPDDVLIYIVSGGLSYYTYKIDFVRDAFSAYRNVVTYSGPNITIPAGLKIIDIVNLNEPGTLIQYTIVDATHINITTTCETNDNLKITGIL